MNALDQARSAYAATAAPLRTPRATEYEAFARITARIRKAAEGGRHSFPALAAALTDNRQLWTLLAAEVADGGNALPPPLRAQIFYLAEFTDHQTRKVLKGEARADVLVEINAAVMRGLGAEAAGP